MVDRVHNYGGPSKISVMGIREIKTALDTSQYFGKLGDVKVLGMGREVVFAKLSTAAATAAMVAGSLMQAPAPVANHMQLAAAATASIGATTVFVALGATAAAKDAYKDGLLHISSGAGSGYSYMIQGNPSAAASATSAKITLKDGLEVALTTASICNLIPNPCNNVTITTSCAAKTSHPVGVLLFSAALTNGGYCYLGKRGIWPALVEGTELTGKDMTVGSAAGTVRACGTGSLTFGYVGKCVVTGQTTCLVDFKL